MHTDKLAYFFDAHDLGHVFVDWPEEIGLVLCLDGAGLCEILLHHDTERSGVLKKAAAVLDCPDRQFAVVPSTEGYPTRRVLFTDEQKLLALIEDEDDLAELAQDYLINHRFEAERKAAPKPSPLPLPKVPSLSETFRWTPRLHLSEVRSKARRPEPAADLPEGFAAMVSDDDCALTEAVLSVEHGSVRLVFGGAPVGINTPTRRAAKVGFRDDYSCFVVPREAVGKWRPGEPLVLDMPEGQFPAALRQRYAKGARVADVTVTGQGVFVTPGALVPPEQEPEAAPAPVRRARLFRPLYALLLCMVCVGVAAGSVLRDGGHPVLTQWLAPQTVADTRLASR